MRVHLVRYKVFHPNKLHNRLSSSVADRDVQHLVVRCLWLWICGLRRNRLLREPAETYYDANIVVTCGERAYRTQIYTHALHRAAKPTMEHGIAASDQSIPPNHGSG